MFAPFHSSAVSRRDGSTSDGIHILWTAPPRIGYSIEGFDIQRRDARERGFHCTALSPAQLQILHQSFRLSVSPALLAVRRTPCPTFPKKPPDEPVREAERPSERKVCADFGRLEPGRSPNPLRLEEMTFEIRSGEEPERFSQVETIKSHTGVLCGEELHVVLPEEIGEVELTLVHFGEPPSLEAYGADGSRLDVPQPEIEPAEPQTLTISGEAIQTVVIGGGDRVLLLRLCRQRKVDDREPRDEPRDEEKRPSAFPAPRLALDPEIGARLAVTPHPSGGCLVYDLRFRLTHQQVRIEAGLPAMLAIALRDCKALDTRLAAQPGNLQTVTFEGRLLDQVLLYAGRTASSLTICVDQQDPDREEREWDGAPFIARNVHLPVRTVNPALAAAADEDALASSRVLPPETFAQPAFREVAVLMNETSQNPAEISPMVQTVLTREKQDDPFLELRAWPYAFSLLVDAQWRRMLGFAFLDEAAGLVPGQVYDYRVTGRFRRRELHERLLGFHTVPLETMLPRWFHLGSVLLQTERPTTVQLFPKPPANGLRAVGVKGIPLSPVGPGGRSLRLTFESAVSSLILELEPSLTQGLSFKARTSDYLLGLSGSVFSGAVPANRRVQLDFAEPVDTVTFSGAGFFYGVRVHSQPPAGDPEDVLSISVVVPGIRFEATAPPPAPSFLGTVNLQQPMLPGDPAVTTQQPPQHMGFRLFWYPPPTSGVAPWPPDLAAFPPFDVMSFDLERRRVDTGGGFEELDGASPPTRFFGNRSSRSDPPQLHPGIDLLAVFPEEQQPVPPVSVLIEAEDTLRSLAKPAGPPPGSLHQYQVFSVDAIGRRSAAPTVGSVVRLEKRIPPPQPVGTTTPPPAGVERPVGVAARVLQSLDTRLTPTDQALLGSSTNAIVLEWAWTQAERDRDPFATEFRVYYRPLPPDLVRGSLNGTATAVGNEFQMQATLQQPVPADALKGRYLPAGDRSYKVASNTAGANITVRLAKSAIDPSATPQAGPFELAFPPDASELRPERWPERTAVVPITGDENYRFIFRDRLTLTPGQPNVRVWVGVSTADDQSYIPDAIPAAQPNGGRPGNESSIAAAPANARYLGRPLLTVPPPLPDVPEQVTDEPVQDRVSVRLDLPALLPAVSIPAGHQVLLERLGAGALLNRISARNDDRIGARLPDGSTPSYVLGNPADQEAFLAQIRTGEGVRVEDRFVMDFLTRHLAALEVLWERALPGPVPFGQVTDRLPGKADRYLHRFRLVDQAGHVSAGGAILPQFVRIPSLASPAAPSIWMPGSETDTLTLTARLREVFDLKWLVLFTRVADDIQPADEKTLVKPQLLRLPNRRDLYPNDGIRLRLADGTLLTPATAAEVSSGTLEVPDRVLTVPVAAGFGKRVTVWALAMTRDGITSRLTPPLTAFTGAPPLTVPALTVTAVAGADEASWGALPGSVEASLERSVDGGSTWQRVTPWLTTTSFSIAPVAGPRSYRLALRANRGRRAFGPAVTPS